MAEIAALFMRPPGKSRRGSCQINSTLGDPSRSMAFHMLNGTQAGLLSPRDAKLTQTIQALVCLYFDEGVVALIVVNGKSFHVGDFHICRLSIADNIRPEV